MRILIGKALQHLYVFVEKRDKNNYLEEGRVAETLVLLQSNISVIVCLCTFMCL